MLRRCRALLIVSGMAIGAAGVTDAASAAGASSHQGQVSRPLVGASTLDPSERARLGTWYRALGPRRPSESFGALVARAATVQLGKPYFDPPVTASPERLEVRLGDFHCVSLVESSLAVARCTVLGTPDADCFGRELEALRYRGGTLAGFGSRMHYFVEWVSDNAERGNVRDVTAALGGAPTRARFDYMTRHARRYPPLAAPETLAELRAVEARLSATRPIVVDRAGIGRAEASLEPGDVLGFVGAKPGLVITHVGLVLRGADGATHLLHASSHHGRVLVTSTGVADYVLRRPERLGLVVARPLEPEVVIAAAPPP